MNLPVVMFDMDGTLTLPRKKIGRQIIRKLRDLSDVAQIGIVTGSGYDYLVQQCQEMWYDVGSVPVDSVVLMPCNGTQLYKPSPSRRFELVHKADMREELGNDSVDKIMACLIHMQFLHMTKDPSHSYTGHFVSYRDSLINWCPVGRNANDDQRSGFIDFDKETNCRIKAKDMIQKYLMVHDVSNVTLALGGSTSIDIFPTGWDKTYALQHFPDRECWFVGDSCRDEGNDRALYEELRGSRRAYETTCPAKTIEIIDDIIGRIQGATCS